MEAIFTAILELGQVRQVPQFLFLDGVDHSSMMDVRRAVIEFKSFNPSVKEIDFIINSPGGLADAAYRIIRTLRKNFETVNIVVPFWAKSAATLLSLGGTRIIMDEFGEFGPLDAQLAKERDDSPEMLTESALNDEHSLSRIETRFKNLFETTYLRLYEHSKIRINKIELAKQLLQNASTFYLPLLKQIDPYRLGEKRRILDIGGQYAKKILAQFSPGITPEKAYQLTDYLVDSCPDHGYVIDYDIMKLLLPQVVVASEELGPDYREKLTELSNLLIDMVFSGDRTSYVGFVEAPAQEEEPVEAGSGEAEGGDNILPGESFVNEKSVNIVPPIVPPPTSQRKITKEKNHENHGKTDNLERAVTSRPISEN